MLFSSFIICYLTYKLFLKFYGNWLLVDPCSRSSHTIPTPSGGGAVFASLSFLYSFLFFRDCSSDVNPLQILALIPLVITGILDDKYSIKALYRIIVQALTGIMLLIFFGITSTLFFLVFLLLYISLINLFNFMDGIDGLLGGCALCILITVGIVNNLPLPIWALIGGLIAFMHYNWSPARLFMGDVGSTFLGAIFGVLCIHEAKTSGNFSLIMTAFPILADSSICLFRRMLAGDKLSTPHRQHLYQRLCIAGLSHKLVSSIYITATVVLCILYAVNSMHGLIAASLLILILGYLFEIYISAPFANQE